MTTLTEKQKSLLFDANTYVAQHNFFHFCKLLAPDFYMDSRNYLVEMCNALQDFYENSTDKILIINLPPRHGKSRTLTLFTTWLLGKKPTLKIMTGSYNEELSRTFSRAVRNTIQTIKVDDYKVVYSDIFPKTKIKRGDAAVNRWSTVGGHNNYIATSPGGSATGFGADLIVIDDMIKNAEEAFNENAKQKQWDWFVNTMLSRLEKGGKIIIVMTRWASDDISGKLVDYCKMSDIPYKQILYKAIQKDGTALCPEIFSVDDYEMRKSVVDESILSANYQQEPIDLQNRLYPNLLTYEDIPRDDKGNTIFEQVGAYIDTADTGADYLAMFVYGVYQKQAYILDTYYTLDHMEITEPETARILFENKVNVCWVESNSGGRGFARNVKKILDEKYPEHMVTINTFHQSKNKDSRILSQATWIMNNIFFPVNWHVRWRELYDTLYKYQKGGKNAHDDAPDALTGVAERVNVGKRFGF